MALLVVLRGALALFKDCQGLLVMCTFSVRKEKFFLERRFFVRKEICSPARVRIDLLHAARELK